jgi:hypothetical protein
MNFLRRIGKISMALRLIFPPRSRKPRQPSSSFTEVGRDPWCRTQVTAFVYEWERYLAGKVQILGVSVDPPEEGKKFLERVTRDCQEDRPHISLRPVSRTTPNGSRRQIDSRRGHSERRPLGRNHRGSCNLRDRFGGQGQMGLRQRKRLRSSQPRREGAWESGTHFEQTWAKCFGTYG